GTMYRRVRAVQHRRGAADFFGQRRLSAMGSGCFFRRDNRRGHVIAAWLDAVYPQPREILAQNDCQESDRLQRMSDVPLLQVREATKQYGGVMAVQNISFDLHAGEIVGLIGPNGAGKTTLINLITGTAIPTRGTIQFEGERLNGLKPYVISRKGISRTFQVVRPFANLTVLENAA